MLKRCTFRSKADEVDAGVALDLDAGEGEVGVALGVGDGVGLDLGAVEGEAELVVDEGVVQVEADRGAVVGANGGRVVNVVLRQKKRGCFIVSFGSSSAQKYRERAVQEGLVEAGLDGDGEDLLGAAGVGGVGKVVGQQGNLGEVDYIVVDVGVDGQNLAPAKVLVDLHFVRDRCQVFGGF